MYAQFNAKVEPGDGGYGASGQPRPSSGAAGAGRFGGGGEEQAHDDGAVIRTYLWTTASFLRELRCT